MFINHPSSNRRTPGLLIASFFALTVAFTACKDEENPITVPTAQTITELVTSNPQFTLLSAAVTRAGLGSTLSGTGPFTVFAPSDDAFRAAGFANAAAFDAVPVATLTNILLYHVASGSLSASAISAGQTAQPTALTANGTAYVSKVTSTSGTGVSVNGARVVLADVQASNGIIHVIDRVLMPPAGSILAVAQADTTLSYLVAAALRGGPAVTGALGGTTALTVFAPTNSAFRAAGFPTIASISAAPEATLTSILTYHVIPGVRAYSPTLTNGATITTFQTGTVAVGVTPTAVTVTGRGNNGTASNVTTADISATNGVIHKIDRVLLP
ncbi:fasciclin domain-containing protein [Spirosoma utsteinense]|uniref:Surface protein n=1 Tax=Spirosoma utsteinense TaxID=2585773 RepID=A0ABR6W7R2_9BACT|nr:fasciclin domain-containing protein [Spirosoma utsteinense]MBC3783908.1 putative surface protein [Spirosoma utsteinense]MBC3792542.1 putative surface protein [Spirosoma utsteinense]